MSNSLDLTSVPSTSNSDTTGSSETSTGLNYQQTLDQVKCLDLIFFKKNSSSVSSAPSSSKTRDSKYSHAGMIVNSEVLPGIAGMKTGSYYVLQTSGSGDLTSSDGSVAPAPDSTDTTETSNGRSIKYYGVHLTELGTVLKRYTNPDLSTGVALAKFSDNPLIQGANESSSKFKKRKKTIISQIEQFYQKSKARNLGRKIFGLMRKSNKRPEGLKFSHHILHTGSTYDAYGQNWSTHPIEQFYQHLGWLQIPEDSSEAPEDPEPTSVVDPATAPVTSGADVNWAAPTDPSATTDPSVTATTDPSVTGTTDPSVTATTDPSVTATTDPSVAGTTDPSTTETTDPSTTETTDPSTDASSDPADFPTITGSVENLNTIVDPPTDVYCAPGDTFEDDGDYQDLNVADPPTPTETVDAPDAAATTTPSATTDPSVTATTGSSITVATGSSSSIDSSVAATGSSSSIGPSTSSSPSASADPSTNIPSTGTDASTTSVAPVASTASSDPSAVATPAVPSSAVAAPAVPSSVVAAPAVRSPAVAAPAVRSPAVATPDTSVAAPTVTPTTSAMMIASNSSSTAASTPKYAAAPSTDTEYW